MTDDKPDVDGIEFETAVEAVRHAEDALGGVEQYALAEGGGLQTCWAAGPGDRVVPVMVDWVPMVVARDAISELQAEGLSVLALARVTQGDGRTFITILIDADDPRAYVKLTWDGDDDDEQPTRQR